TGFIFLLVCRAGVAIAEAVINPAAVSLIADLFRKDKRALPRTIYAATGILMSTGGFVVGAAVLQLTGLLALSGAMEPWRLTLIAVGIPGVVLGFIFFFSVAEPGRTNSCQESAKGAI